MTQHNKDCANNSNKDAPHNSNNNKMLVIEKISSIINELQLRDRETHVRCNHVPTENYLDRNVLDSKQFEATVMKWRQCNHKMWNESRTRR